VKWIFQRDIESPAVLNLLSAKHSTAAVSIASRVRTVTGVSRDRCTIICGVKQASWTRLTLKMKTLQSFGTSVN